MPRVKEQPHLGAGNGFGKIADRPVHGSLVEINALDNDEPQLAQGLGDIGGVVLRVGELAGIAVLAVADHKRDAFSLRQNRRSRDGGQGDRAKQSREQPRSGCKRPKSTNHGGNKHLNKSGFAKPGHAIL